MGCPIRLHDVFLEVTRKAIVEVLFGNSNEALVRNIDAQADEILTLFSTGSTFRDPDARLSDALKTSTRQMRSIIAECMRERSTRCSSSARVDILDHFLSHGVDVEMSHESLCQQLITLLFAGYETTAATLSWAIMNLVDTPGVLARLRRELGDSNGLDAVTLTKLPYLEMVCKETLRINPAIPIVSRELQQPQEIAGFPLPRGTYVSPCPYLTHRRADIFQKPAEFRPERFASNVFSPFEYFPFGGGNRLCVGRQLAMFELKIVLGAFLGHFRKVEPTDQAVRPVRRSVTVVPSHGLPMRLTRSQ